MAQTTLDFLEEYRKTHDGIVAGSYCLHLLHGTEYNDIDFFTPLTYDVLDIEPTDKVSFQFKVKEELYIGGKKFILNGKNYPKQFDFASYKCDDFTDGVALNITFVHQPGHGIWIYHLLQGFDMDILRVAISSKSPLDKVDIQHETYLKCVETKQVPVIIRNSNYKSWHDQTRIEKYKKRFPDYEFYKPL